MQPVMRREGGGGGDREGGAGSLWEGQYDEKASARSFQEALQEWRAGRSGLLSFMCKILSVRDKKLHWLGIEPRSTAWNATLLTITPPPLNCCMHTYTVSFFPVSVNMYV